MLLPTASKRERTDVLKNILRATGKRSKGYPASLNSSSLTRALYSFHPVFTGAPTWELKIVIVFSTSGESLHQALGS